ncbi:MAG: Dihydrolipoyllysine-residue acetyltransferase component of acetoin cleaving system [Syntrophaceae bacterium PtaU1.Bin231]|nr:MAG: Dihydrolipoyllysine-residue acetyltransferase component of acetoin cleaving system [Syntrophaceae bacterium PtaU1.Bin231]
MTSAVEPRVLRQDIGDAEISYLSYDGDGPVVLLLHATGFLPWLWHPIARALTPDYRVVAPYLCDHRQAEPEDGGLDWLTLAGDMARFCDRLGIGNVFVTGHSMGATVTTIAHVRFGLRTAGLVLIEPVLLPPELYGIRLRVEDHPFASRAIKRTNGWSDEEDAMRYLQSRELFRNWDAEILHLYLRHGMKPSQDRGLRLACDPRSEAALFMGSVRFDPWPLLPQVRCPVLILEGEKSDQKSYVDLKKAAAAIPRASHQIVAGAGHLVPMEKPRVVAETLREFFGARLRSSS